MAKNSVHDSRERSPFHWAVRFGSWIEGGRVEKRSTHKNTECRSVRQSTSSWREQMSQPKRVKAKAAKKLI